MIRLNNIVKEFSYGREKLLALNNVNLHIAEGELVAVMGASGSGKSTLLNIIGCMDEFNSGEYYLDGIEIHNIKKSKIDDIRKKYISMVFQNFALLNHNTVYENIEIPLIARGIHKKERKQLIEDALDRFSIREVSEKLPTLISGGQQQRCAIARAVVSECKIILADEPTGALDSKTGNDIMNIFCDMRKIGKTIIIVTHDINIANQCDRIINISDGKIKE